MKKTKLLFGILSLTLGALLQTQAQYPFTNGLVAYYPLNGNANDASGNGNNGTINKGVTLTMDRFARTNGAYDFDGSTGFIGIPQNPILNLLTTNFTLSAWVWQRGADFDGYRIIDKCTAGEPDGWTFDTVGCNSTGHALRLQAANTNASCNVGGETDYSLMQWHHVVAIASGTNGTVYLDGKLDGTGNVGNIPANTLDVYIGMAHPGSGAGFYFNGIIDEVRIYNRALSAAEVQQLYDYESGPRVGLIKAVKPSFSTLTPGVEYQLQASLDLNTWYDQGLPFSATSTNMVSPWYYDVDSWDQLFFRLQVFP
ncbi:MAG: LamG domain-containing protein [Verrucomicrobia bacterium]|nr:LamG domain-containing protein [Verrucomicrobiota bacterium]